MIKDVILADFPIYFLLMILVFIIEIENQLFYIIFHLFFDEKDSSFCILKIKQLLILFILIPVKKNEWPEDTDTRGAKDQKSHVLVITGNRFYGSVSILIYLTKCRHDLL